MTPETILTVNTILVVLGLIFQAGGTYRILTNHMQQVNAAIEKVEEQIGILREDVARLEGRLNNLNKRSR